MFLRYSLLFMSSCQGLHLMQEWIIYRLRNYGNGYVSVQYPDSWIKRMLFSLCLIRWQSLCVGGVFIIGHEWNLSTLQMTRMKCYGEKFQIRKLNMSIWIDSRIHFFWILFKGHKEIPEFFDGYSVSNKLKFLSLGMWPNSLNSFYFPVLFVEY